jgi:hypothetical protein
MNPSARIEEIEMTGTINNPERIEYRLVMIDPYSTRILTIKSTARLSLPRESIPAYTRVAEALTEAIEQRYGLRTIQLAILPRAEEQTCCAVHEILGPLDSVAGQPSLATLDEIAPSELAETERAIVLKIMTGGASELGRFARVGWIDELLARTGSHRDESSMPVIRHLNQGIDFCLLNLKDADGRNLWFKAVGEPNTREYALTVELARRFPEYLPKILATIPEWNGWIMEDIKGVPLNKSTSIYQCEQTLTALAVMQKKMVNDVALLSALGAKDLTCVRIASLLEPLFREALSAMQAQTSTRSKPLAGSELYQLQKDMESALDEFLNAGIPETLLHGDIGHGNIIATSNGPVFLDWAETYIGHPFLSAEHLLADLARSNPFFAEYQAVLRHHYSAHWTTYARQGELERVTALAPAIGAFVYAVIAWDANRNRANPAQAWPLMRSMLRRTKQDLDQMPECIA